MAMLAWWAIAKSTMPAATAAASHHPESNRMTAAVVRSTMMLLTGRLLSALRTLCRGSGSEAACRCLQRYRRVELPILGTQNVEDVGEVNRDLIVVAAANRCDVVFAP